MTLIKNLCTKAVGIALVMTALTAGAQDRQLTLDGSTTVGPIAKAFAEYYMNLHKDVNITVSESGSGNGAKSLVNGACDVATMSRPMKLNEAEAAIEKGIQPCPHVVALDGIAMVVHPSNPVNGLTLDQVRQIYLGRITNWRQVGGPNMPIVVVTRDTNSGTFESFEKLVMNREKITQAAETVGSNGAARTRTATTRGVIAFIGLGYVNRAVKALEINGVFPEQVTVATGEYPISRPLYMYTNGYPKLGSLTHAFITLHLTEKGQEIVESIGFVPVTNY